MKFRRSRDPGFKRTADKDCAFGDWRAIYKPKTPIPCIGLAWHAHSARLMAEMASAIGKKDRALRPPASRHSAPVRFSALSPCGLGSWFGRVSTMAVRIDPASVLKGVIDNRIKGTTQVRLECPGGFITEISLKGNTWRDVAGRVLTLHNPRPDSSLPHPSSLLTNDHGIAGDITAARKVKVLQDPGEEPLKPGHEGGPPRHVWKNSLYLEWFTLNGGRIVLEATDFEMTLSEPEWIMTEEEEKETHQHAREALVNFMDQLVDLEASRKQIDTMTAGKENLNEFEWEQLMKHSDKVTDRYMELLDKFGHDEETLDELMGWEKPPAGPEQVQPFEDAWLEDPLSDDDMEEPPEHPLRTMASDLLDQMTSRKNAQDSLESELWFAVANIGAKLSGALSAYRGDHTFDDNGFTIAHLKRVLALVNETTPMMQKINPGQLRKLMQLRQSIIDLQQELRRVR